MNELTELDEVSKRCNAGSNVDLLQKSIRLLAARVVALEQRCGNYDDYIAAKFAPPVFPAPTAAPGRQEQDGSGYGAWMQWSDAHPLGSRLDAFYGGRDSAQQQPLTQQMTLWRYAHDEIEAACGGETALMVREKVMSRRARIDKENGLASEQATASVGTSPTGNVLAGSIPAEAAQELRISVGDVRPGLGTGCVAS